MKSYMADAIKALELAQEIARQRGDESEAYGLESAKRIVSAYSGTARVKKGAPIRLNGK